MFCCSLTTCTDQTSTDIFGAENSSVLRTSFIADTYRCASSCGVLRRNAGNWILALLLSLLSVGGRMEEQSTASGKEATN
jgi:hypothetical protein